MSSIERVRRYVRPATTRSRLVLEVASELVGAEGWPYQQARVSLREQGADRWKVNLFGSDAPAAIDEVIRGEALVAMVNPASPVTLAVRGTGPFRQPAPLRAIAVVPSRDQLALAITGRTGATSLAEIRDRRLPIRVSLRAEPHHSVHFVVEQALSSSGFSLEDIPAWGGKVRYDEGMPDGPNRIGAVERGEADAIFDETGAVNGWANMALDLGMRFLPIEEPELQHLERLGFRRAAISKARFPRLAEDVPTLDFSGWVVFTHANAPDELITSFCAALEARKDRIPWQGEGPLPLERMCRDTPEGPLDIPLHPAAQRFWRERGFLP